MENELSHKIIGAAIEVHKVLGPGLLEGIYEEALCHELKLRGMQVKRQIAVPVIYKDVIVKNPFFLDVLVDDMVIVEVKATEQNHSIYECQVLTYLKLTKIKLGLLINFGNALVKDGIIRVAHNL